MASKPPKAAVRKVRARTPKVTTFASYSKRFDDDALAELGNYADSPRFGDNARSFTIGSIKYTKSSKSPGPGEYESDKSLSITRARPTSALISKCASYRTL